MFVVHTTGYYGCPEYPTLTLARAALGALVRDELAACRRRFGQATKVKNGTDNYTIKIGDAQSVSHWSSHCILRV